MTGKDPLSSIYRLFKAGVINARELENRVFNYISESRNREFGLFFRNRCERIDFLGEFFPRLRRAIERYNSDWATFDAYIATTLRYAYREYRALAKRQQILQCVGFDESVREPETDAAAPETADGDEPQDEPQPDPFRIGSPQHALIILLKSYYFVTDGLIAKAAPAIGLDADVLAGMVDRLHGLRLKKEEHRKRLANAVHCQYYRNLFYERRLAFQYKDTEAYDRFSMRLDRGRQRLERLRVRLRALRMEATNAEVAALLGIPKGTVDSRVSLIKSRLSSNVPMF